MVDAVMLFDGTVVPISEISDSSTFNPNDPNIQYFDDYYDEIEINGQLVKINKVGRVKRFVKNGKAYFAIFREFENSKLRFEGYFSEKKFWDNNRVTLKSKNTTTAHIPSLSNMFTFNMVNGLDNNSKVYFAYKFATKESNIFKLIVNYQFILFSDIHKNSNLLTCQSPLQITVTSILTNLEAYANFIINKQYLRPNGNLGDLENNELNVLYDIIFIFNEFMSNSSLQNYLNNNKLNDPFEKHIKLAERFNSNYGEKELEYHKHYNEEYFARLRLSLIDFRSWLLNYHDDYNKINKKDILVLIINLFTTNDLSSLEYDTKVNFITEILNKSFFIQGNWFFNLINEEQAILKVIQSIERSNNGTINYDEIDCFIDLLNSTYDKSTKKTLYEILYYKIDDALFFDDAGNGNKGQLVRAIYNLWTKSKYNPYHIDSYKADLALSHFSYTSYPCYWMFQDHSIPIQDRKLDFSAAPMVINYESDKTLLWYIDNFVFYFVENKIHAQKDSYGSIPQVYGSYNIFQPVSIRAAIKNDLSINLPLLNLSEKENPTESELVNCVPIFYLAYADDVGDRSDVKNTISTTFDVILTFTGIGNLPKLRHLKNISLLRKLLPGSAALSALEQAKLIRAMKGLFSSSQAFLGVASLTHRILTSNICFTNFHNSQNQIPGPLDPTYNDYNECQSLIDEANSWLGAAEIFALSAELITRNMLKKATLKLRQKIPNNSIYDDLRIAVNQFDNLEQELETFLISNPAIANKLNQLNLNTAQKIEFMLDFADDSEAWVHFSANLNDIDNWKKLYLLEVPDKNVLNIVKDSTLTNSFEKLYTRTALKGNLNHLTKQRRLEFAEMAKNGDTHWLDRLADRPNALNRWNNSIQARAIAKQNPRIWLYIADDLPVGTTFSKVPGNSIKWELVDLDGIVHFRLSKTGPPPDFNFEALIKFKKLTVEQQQAKIDEAIDAFRLGTIKYSTVKAYQGTDIPISSYDNVLGMAPDFKGLGMAFDPPHSFNLGIMGDLSNTQISQIQDMLSEPLSSIINKVKAKGNGVKVPIVEGTRIIDYQNMWRKMGIDPKDGQIIKEELSLDIHHLDDLDYDLHTTLQIVTNKAHNVTKSHSGSVKLNEILYNLINDIP